VNVHHVTLSAFCDRAGAQSLSASLSAVLPADSDIEEVVIEPETEGGVFLREMLELRCRLTKAKDVKEFTERLFRGLDEYDRRRIIERLADSIDDDCVLYVRLSKTEAAGGRFVLEGKDPIHVSLKLAAFPARKENAIAAAKELIEVAIR
jgi:RNA-binding protein